MSVCETELYGCLSSNPLCLPLRRTAWLLVSKDVLIVFSDTPYEYYVDIRRESFFSNTWIILCDVYTLFWYNFFSKNLARQFFRRNKIIMFTIHIYLTFWQESVGIWRVTNEREHSLLNLEQSWINRVII